MLKLETFESIVLTEGNAGNYHFKPFTHNVFLFLLNKDFIFLITFILFVCIYIYIIIR